MQRAYDDTGGTDRPLIKSVDWDDLVLSPAVERDLRNLIRIMKPGEAELHTHVAPAARSRSAWASERTMQTSGMPSARHRRLSIWPRFDAAAVCTSAVCPSARIVSTMPSTVSGFTNAEAPSTARVPSGSSRQRNASACRYCAYIPPPATATSLPSRACAAAEDPAATTVPAPSLPAGSDWPTRAAAARAAPGGSGAVTTGRSGVPP